MDYDSSLGSCNVILFIIVGELQVNSSIGGWNTILMKEYIVMVIYAFVMPVREMLIG